MMSYFEGFDDEHSDIAKDGHLPEGGKQSFDGEIPREATGSQLDQDTAEFLSVRARLLEELTDGTVPPSGAITRTNTPKNPFDDHFMIYRALRTAGYGIYLVDNAIRPSGEAAPSSLAVYTDQSDNAAINVLMHHNRRMMFSLEPQPFARLLHAVCDGYLSPQYLNPSYEDAVFGDILSIAELERGEVVRPGQNPEDIRKNLLVCGFLSSTVFAKIRRSFYKNTDPGPLSMIDQMQKNEVAIYNRLSAEGARPFNVEELYGMAAAAVKYVVKANPDIPRPANQQLQEPEY